MTKRYSYFKSELTDLFVIIDELHKETFSGIDDEYNCIRIVRKLNTLIDENKQLKQYKQSVNDVLKSWSQKNLTAKQLQVVLAIMEELNVIGDVE